MSKVILNTYIPLNKGYNHKDNMITHVSLNRLNKASSDLIASVSLRVNDNRLRDKRSMLTIDKGHGKTSRLKLNHASLNKSRDHISKTKDMQKVWLNSFAHNRADLLRQIGITDPNEITKLIDFNYVNLSSDVRFNLECGI